MTPAASANPLSRTVSASSANIHEIEKETSPDTPPSRSDAQPDGALTMLSRAPSKRGKETADATAHASHTASHLHTVGLQISQPVMPSHPGKASLVRLKEKLAADNHRAVEPRLAAELINKVRPMKLPDTTGVQKRAATHTDLLSRIHETDAMAWYKAQGLSEVEVSDLRRTALLSGMPNPTGSFLNNAMQFIVSPWINYATRQPWAGAGFGFATAAIAAPMNAVQQSAVVSLCKSIREHGGHVIVPEQESDQR